MLSSLHLLPGYGCRYTIFLVGRWLLIHIAPTSSPHILHPAPQTCQLPPALIFSILSHLNAASWSIQHCQAVNELTSGLFPGERELASCVCVCIHLRAARFDEKLEAQKWFYEEFCWGLGKNPQWRKNSGWKQLYQKLEKPPTNQPILRPQFSMDLRLCWNEETQECEMKVYVKNQVGWIVLWLFRVNKKVDMCKVSLHAPWTGDRKGEPRALRNVRDWQRVLWVKEHVQGDLWGWNTPKIILLVLFKCHTPGKETFHMFLYSHLQAFSNAPGFCCLMGGSGKLCPGKTLWMSHFPLGKMQAVSSFTQCTVPACILTVLILSRYRKLVLKPGWFLHGCSWLLQKLPWQYKLPVNWQGMKSHRLSLPQAHGLLVGQQRSPGCLCPLGKVGGKGILNLRHLKRSQEDTDIPH